jgi:hypothetical protein
MRVILAAVAIGVLAVGSAWAQPEKTDFSSTVGGVVGGGKTWDDEGSIGTGAFFGFRADRRLFGNTFAELSIDSLQHERADRFVADGRTVLFTGAIVQRFGRGSAQPYVVGGVSLARHNGTFGFPDLGLVSSSKGTKAGVVFGGGVAVRAGTRFEVGPEARFLILTTDNDSSPAFGNWLGVRFAVRF